MIDTTTILYSVLVHLKVFWANASPFALVVFGMHCAFFLCFYIPGLLFRGLVSSFFYILATLCILGTPFTVRYLLEEQLFKIQTDIREAFSLTYTNAFMAKVHVKNVGHLAINQCILRLDILHPSYNKFQEYLHKWVFAHTYTQSFKVQIPPKQAKDLVMDIENYPYKQAPFKLSADCY
ncbi:DUF2393 family protein [Helicobacter heilmannii]|uniref:Putative n=2 Tax=Helicobacter heilmannii TaxID=35817 RepID=A0A0K2Y9P8_HELHE|nr:DUF2393 family protein [Helicobacter heilmannii]BDQ26492.1 hypothetical protein ASB1_01680 [Helicobacter heilmannii]CCM11470.1 hypothetical protein BN341_12740 [Helicobacter heilmannii ASB1.4]CRI34892.1 putative [Helicobacter heilmannii]